MECRKSDIQKTGIPWPVLVFLLAPFAIPLAVCVYLLVLYPKPYFLAIPVLMAVLLGVIYVSERRYPQHVSRVAAALCGPFYFYQFGAGAWYLFGVKYAAGVFVLGLLVTVVLVWKDAFRVRAEEIDWWGRPRDPMDTRTTSPF